MTSWVVAEIRGTALEPELVVPIVGPFETEEAAQNWICTQPLPHHYQVFEMRNP